MVTRRKMTLSTYPYWVKNGPTWYIDMSKGTPCNAIQVLRVPKYSGYSLTDFVVTILPASFLASSFVTSSISQMTFGLLAIKLWAIMRVFIASFIIFRLIPVRLSDLTSQVSSEIVLVATVSKTVGIDSSSLSYMNSSYLSLSVS